jgi:hypothetical protein
MGRGSMGEANFPGLLPQVFGLQRYGNPCRIKTRQPFRTIRRNAAAHFTGRSSSCLTLLVAGAPISSAWHPLTSILRLVVLNLVETVDEFDPPLGQRLLGYVVKLGVQ